VKEHLAGFGYCNQTGSIVFRFKEKSDITSDHFAD